MQTRSHWSAVDHAHMERALRLGQRAAGRTRPNPSVGAVVAKGVQVLGEGSTEPAGGRHAERVALVAAGAASQGATLYVTLEPCPHAGRTPPCTEAIIDAGIQRVVAALRDPSARVDGDGLARLRAAGIQVEVGLKALQAAEDHAPFASWVLRGRPYVVAKWAMTADGRLATSSGDARWISGPRSRHQVHRMRDHCDAIMVGVGTVLQDDPRLSCRLDGGRDPLRVICDSTARTPADACCLAGGPGTLLAMTRRAPQDRRQALVRAGAELLELPAETAAGEQRGRVALQPLLEALAQRDVTSLLVEGGPTLLASLAEADLIDRYEIFLAPKWIGGAGAPAPLEGRGRPRMADAEPLVWQRVRRSGSDIWLSAYREGGHPFHVYWHRG